MHCLCSQSARTDIPILFCNSSDNSWGIAMLAICFPCPSLSVCWQPGLGLPLLRLRAVMLMIVSYGGTLVSPVLKTGVCGESLMWWVWTLYSHPQPSSLCCIGQLSIPGMCRGFSIALWALKMWCRVKLTLLIFHFIKCNLFCLDAFRNFSLKFQNQSPLGPRVVGALPYYNLLSPRPTTITPVSPAYMQDKWPFVWHTSPPVTQSTCGFSVCGTAA